MSKGRARRWVQSLLLAAPLVALTGWLVAVAWSGFATTKSPSRQAAGGSFAGLPAPESDLTADRLEARVDGAAEYLRGLGCTRLVAWRIPAPPSEVELYVFSDAGGAGAALTRDAGRDRTPGPGDEALVVPQSVLFRRGPAYVRILSDPGAAAPDAQLLAISQRIDDDLAKGARP